MDDETTVLLVLLMVVIGFGVYAVYADIVHMLHRLQTLDHTKRYTMLLDTQRDITDSLMSR